MHAYEDDGDVRPLTLRSQVSPIYRSHGWALKQAGPDNYAGEHIPIL
jgi:hypothetical protein